MRNTFLTIKTSCLITQNNSNGTENDNQIVQIMLSFASHRSTDTEYSMNPEADQINGMNGSNRQISISRTLYAFSEFVQMYGLPTIAHSPSEFTR